MIQEGGEGPVDSTSDGATRMIALLRQRGMLVDPTNRWGEIASFRKSVKTVSLEPGIVKAPLTLRVKYESLGASGDESCWLDRMAANGRVIGAPNAAGVPIVAGSDTGLVGYGLDRELEL